MDLMAAYASHHDCSGWKESQAEFIFALFWAGIEKSGAMLYTVCTGQRLL